MKVFKIILFTITLLLVVVFSLRLIFLLKNKFKPIDYFKCVKSNGDYIGLSSPGAPSSGFKCVHTFSDSGKRCYSNDECQGNCLVTKDTIVEKKGIIKSKVVGGFGECEKSDLRHPSYPGDFENPVGWII